MVLTNHWYGRTGARRLIAQPNFKRCKVFDQGLVAIELHKTHVILSKPICVGMSVLDLSKLVMYSFMYDFLKKKYNDKLSLAYVDTDAFLFHVHTHNFYDDMRQHSELFDTSDYPYPNVYNIERKNKKVPGLFKDELNGVVINEFVGLRAKCYAIRSLDIKKPEKIKKSKGIKKCVVKNKIKFDHYIKCLKSLKTISEKQKTIRSISHNVYSIEQEKVALNPLDDKRYLIKPNRIETLSWGHYAINILEKRDN